MNKVMLMGNLTRDPEVRYSQSANPLCIARYGLAVRRPFHRQGDPDVDFFNIAAFGKAGEFAEKFFQKGQKVVIVGRLQVNTWEDDKKVKHTKTEIVVEEQHFAESKSTTESRLGSQPQQSNNTSTYNSGSAQGFIPPEEDDDDDLPF